MGFGATLVQLWATLITILKGIEEFASGFKNMGEWTNESTKAFVDEARITRAQKLAKLEADLAVQAAASANTKQQAAASVNP